MSFDLRITYLCAHCGQFATMPFWALEVLDSGTMFTCEYCSKDTVVDLFTPVDRGTFYRAMHKEPPSFKPVPPNRASLLAELEQREEGHEPELQT